MHARSKRTRLLVYAAIATLAIVGVLAATSKGGPANPGQGSPFYAPHVPGELLIKFKDTAGPNEKANIRAQMNADRVKQFRSGAEHWRLHGRSTEQAIASLRGNPHVRYVEPNYIVQSEITPNDARYPELWGMNNTGQTGGTPGADIDAERAWSVSTGSSSVLVAVIDTGIDYNHPDLAANAWTNPGEIAGNGIDDDGNGFIDDIHGWDFYNNDNDPFDDNGHGTHVSGTIGAVGNNGIGVAGVSWNVKIMGVKFLSGGGSGSTAGAISSVDYATMMGVSIMSNSWGGGGFSQALLDSINAAAAQEIVFVAAAGNSGSNNDVTPHYPSSYDAPNVIAVMATDDNDARSIWPSGNSSSYGATSVDIAAPGTDILSTTPGNTYSVYSGTSMATPHVSGAAALLRAVAPNTSAALVRQILMNFGDPVPALSGLCVSGRRLNAFFPIAEPDDVPPGAIADLAATSATSNSLFLGWTATGDDGSVGTASDYDLRYSTAPIDDTNFGSATKATGVPAPGPSGSAESTEVLGLVAGTQYYFAIKAKDEWGNIGPISNVAVGVTLPPPTFASSPDSFSADLLTGQMATRTLTIQNAGVGTLDWHIPLPSVSGPVVTLYEPIVLDKTEPDPRPGVPALEGFGGPDNFGYRWIDSDEPGGPVFSWTDIAATGTPIAGLDADDQNAGPIPIGFNFPFYGANFNAVRVSTNGWISFTSTATSYSNQPLPNSGAPENLIAPFWDDLHFRGAQRATYASVGGNFVVQFTEVDTYATGSVLTFQVELQPSGEIRLRYLTMTGTLTSATIGIQNAAKDDGLTVVFNDTYVHSGLEIRIAALPQWLTATPTSGRLNAGQSADVTVTIDATGLDGGTYEGSVNVGTNDPTQPVVGHPVTLNVTGAPAISVSPQSIDFGQIYLGFTGTQSFAINNTGTDTLTVSSIVSGNPQVTVAPDSLSIPAHSSATIVATYTPVPPPGALATTLTINSDASNAPMTTVSVAGSTVPAPGALVTPTSFSETLFTGGSVQRNMRVVNTGGSNLILNLSVNLGTSTQATFADPIDLPKGDDSDAGTGDNIVERIGGPDGFGYRYKDSDAAGGPAFSWVDISTTGTSIPLTGDDALSAAIPIGFNFPFYGNAFSTLRVSTNGWISFTSGITTGSASYSNQHLPTGGTTYPENLLALFWDDLTFSTTPKARYLNDGTRFIVQYTGVTKLSSTSPLTFQVLLYPSGKIVFQYLSMAGTLNSATIGIQNATRTIGLETSYNENYVHNNLAIEYSRIPSWLEVAPASATIPPGGFKDFLVSMTAGDSGNRLFQGSINIGTNIPDPALITVPAQLQVIGVADVATNPTSFDYGTRFVGYPHIQKLFVRNVGTADLTVNAVTSSDPALFIEEPISGGAQFTIPAGGQVEYNMRWLPTAPGPLNATVTVFSDDPDEAQLAVPVTGTAIPAPILGWSPGSFSDSLYVGEQSMHNLHITNSGGSDLHFNIGVRLTDANVVQDNSPDVPKGVEPTVHGGPVTAGAGGPDMFGYRWKDSDEPGGPVFDWFDISTIGTPVAGLDGDDEVASAPINLGFSFPFYGNTFNQIWLATNGWMSFSSTTSTRLTNYALPSTNGEANMLAPFWDDLDFEGVEKARYYGDGTRFIVQYTNVEHYPGGSGATSFTFQVILYPSGKIVYQYRTLTGTPLDSNTVGLQNATKDDGLNIAYNQAYLHNNLAVEIQTIADWLTVEVSSGTIPAGGSLDIPVHFDATDLIGGLYSGALRILSNDPARGLVEIPATLAVTGYPAIAATPTALDFGTVFVGVSKTLPVTIKNPGTDVLHVTNVAVSGDYTVDTTPFSLAVGGSRTLNVTFAPSTDGTRTGSIVLTSDATGMPELTVPLTGNGLFPPVAEPDPAQVAELETEALPPGGSKTETLTLYNTGQSDLTWTASVTFDAAPGAPEPVIQPAVELPKGDTSADGTGWHIERAGGPDTFGYRYRDSDEPGGPVFDWFDISAIGTPVAGLDADDEYVGPLALPFNLPFYGNTFNQFWISTNGWLSLSAPSSSSLTNYPLPNANGQPNMIAPFWDDLDFEGVQHATTYYDGSRFIIQYTNVEHYPGGAGTTSYTFQIILYPSGRVVFQYLSLTGNLISHSIGIQNQAENDGLGVTYNEDPPYVHDGLAIEFFTVPEWLTVDPASGVIPAGGHQDITVTINAAGLENGDYSARITFLTNDPFNSAFDVPVNLHVGQIDLAYIDVDPNTLNLSSSGNTIKVVLQLPEGYDPHDIDIESVSIAGQLFANPSPIDYIDSNHDGILELMVKFDRQAFYALVPEGSSVPVTVTGEVHDVTWFTGTDTLRTINPRVTAPNGGNYLIAGRSTTLTWDVPNGGTPNAYDVWLSRDGGETWEVLASNLRSLQYPWSITGPGTDHARIRVLAVDNLGVMGYDTSDADFIIADVLMPPAPIDEVVMSRSGETFTLHWKAPVTDMTHGPAASFRILGSTEANGLFTEIGTTTGESFALPIEANQAGPIMFYRVNAVNGAGETP